MKLCVSQDVVKSQTISHDCLICGEDNPYGLHARYYELANNEVLGVFDAMPEHQSYPGRVHGGIVTAILDETIGRAIIPVRGEMTWGVTTSIEVKFRKPVPYDKPINCIGRVDRDRKRLFEGSAQIVDEDGTVLAEATATYAIFPADKIAEDVPADEVMHPDSREVPAHVQIGC